MGPVPPALAQALAAHQRRLGAGPRAEANALALAQGASAVVAGQQPGLLGGPLLCLHKAAGAVAFARAEAARRGKPVVPVFWIASDDHDWGEVNRATVMDATGSPRDLALEVEGDLRSVRDVPVPATAVEALLGALAVALPATERARSAVEIATPPEGSDVGTWFGVVLARLLGDRGLVLVEPHVLAPWAGKAYARLVSGAERIRDAVREEGDRRRLLGLPAPIDPRPVDAPLFVRDTPDGPRRRVTIEGRSISLRGAPAPLDLVGLENLVRTRPELASGDVVGRVIVQNLVLPVVAQVAGPTEAAYLEQVRAAHEALALPFPQVVARPTATWVEAKTLEALEAQGVPVEAALEGRATPASPPASAPDDPVAARLEDLLARVAALAEEARAGRAASSLERALAPAERDLRRALAAHREEREARAGRGRARLERALVALRPKGKPQERVLSPLSLVARHGLDALRQGLEGLVPGAPHRVVRLD